MNYLKRIFCQDEGDSGDGNKAEFPAVGHSELPAPQAYGFVARMAEDKRSRDGSPRHAREGGAVLHDRILVFAQSLGHLKLIYCSRFLNPDFAIA